MGVNGKALEDVGRIIAIVFFSFICRLVYLYKSFFERRVFSAEPSCFILVLLFPIRKYLYLYCSLPAYQCASLYDCNIAIKLY